jgi:hypothetical protein
MSGLTSIRIEMDAAGHHDVVVDGEAVGDRVAAVDVSLRRGQPSVVSLHQVPGTGVIDGDAIVRLVGDQQDAGEAVRAFLAHLSGAELERLALERMGGMSGLSTGDAFLEVLREAAGGGA